MNIFKVTKTNVQGLGIDSILVLPISESDFLPQLVPPIMHVRVLCLMLSAFGYYFARQQIVFPCQTTVNSNTNLIVCLVSSRLAAYIHKRYTMIDSYEYVCRWHN